MVLPGHFFRGVLFGVRQRFSVRVHQVLGGRRCFIRFYCRHFVGYPERLVHTVLDGHCRDIYLLLVKHSHHDFETAAPLRSRRGLFGDLRLCIGPDGLPSEPWTAASLHFPDVSETGQACSRHCQT